MELSCDLRWAVDEALDGLAGRPVVGLRIPARAWAPFRASVGAVGEGPVLYRGVRVEPGAGEVIEPLFETPAAAAPAGRTSAGAVHGLQPLIFPPLGGPAELYLRRIAGLVLKTRPALQLSGRARLSFDTYANSFYERAWVEHTPLTTVALSLRGRGRLRCRIWRETETGAAALLADAAVALEDNPVLPLALDRTRPGRLYAEIEALGEAVVLDNAAWSTPEPPARPVSLGVGVCTFNREAAVLATVQRLLAAPPQAAVAQVAVVNQGAALDDAGWADLNADPRLSLIAQTNHGGSGGFTRSAMALLETDCSHILFMDDDVELEPGHLVTTAAFLARTEQPVALGGHMLDLVHPTRLYEAGGRIEANAVAPNLHGLELTSGAALTTLAQPCPADFNGWWFTAFPAEAFRAHGLPLPIFIHDDDLEFGLRLAAAGVPTVTAPPVSIWHEPAYAKPPGWSGYYDVRNRLIVAALHPDRLRPEPASALFKRLLGALVRYDYHQAALVRLALSDVLKGPAALDEPAPALHARVSGALAAYAPDRLPDTAGAAPAETTGPSRRADILTALLRVLAGAPGGKGDVLILADAPLSTPLGRRYVMTNAEHCFFLRYRYSFLRTWGALIATGAAIARYALAGPGALARWRAARADLVSADRWRDRLGV